MDKANKIVCNCLQIRRKKIDAVIEENGYTSFEELATKLSVGRICGACQARVKDIITDFYQEK